MTGRGGCPPHHHPPRTILAIHSSGVIMGNEGYVTRWWRRPCEKWKENNKVVMSLPCAAHESWGPGVLIHVTPSELTSLAQSKPLLYLWSLQLIRIFTHLGIMGRLCDSTVIAFLPCSNEVWLTWINKYTTLSSLVDESTKMSVFLLLLIIIVISPQSPETIFSSSTQRINRLNQSHTGTNFEADWTRMVLGC